MSRTLGRGADKYRNPDDDLPKDFEEKRKEYYETKELSHPGTVERPRVPMGNSVSLRTLVMIWGS